MRRRLSFTCLVLVTGILSQAHARAQSSEFLRTNPRFLQAFREVVPKAGQSVVRVQCDGRNTCLGVVVGADGWILTKADDLHGKIACKLRDGQTLEANLVGVHEGHDLALLKIRSAGLSPIAWHRSTNLQAGAWVASVGLREDPVAVGVVSVPTRKVQEAFLGVQAEGLQEGLLVVNVYQKSAAEQGGVRPRDIILRANGQNYTEPESFTQFLAGCRPGDTIELWVRRADRNIELKATLLSREKAGGSRAEYQNRLGSELSHRRSGYEVILQHDSVLKPSDCGGPLVDLRGRVVGINISRAGRVESWSIPAEVAQPLLADLKSGRYRPSPKRFE